MTVFVDTSALYALLSATDAQHAAAQQTLLTLLDAEAELVSTNYVALESASLVQRRLGPDALAALRNGLLPLVALRWVDAALDAEAWGALLERRDRAVSLVDQVSFALMRRESITRAFAFDADFTAHGFERVNP